MSLDCCIDTDDTVNDTWDHNSESKAFDHNSESNPFDHNSQSNTLDHNLESNHLEHNLENTMYHQDNITYHINNILGNIKIMMVWFSASSSCHDLSVVWNF